MWTLPQSASSSSAMISGSDVIDPCPISVAADIIVIAPSGAMLTHGLSDCPVLSLAIRAASAPPPNAMPKDSPAAPIITWRRENWRPEISAPLMYVFMSGLPRGALDRAHDPLVGATATDIGAHVFDDLFVR